LNSVHIPTPVTANLPITPLVTRSQATTRQDLDLGAPASGRRSTALCKLQLQDTRNTQGACFCHIRALSLSFVLLTPSRASRDSHCLRCLRCLRCLSSSSSSHGFVPAVQARAVVPSGLQRLLYDRDAGGQSQVDFQWLFQLQSGGGGRATPSASIQLM
jgi:hypothetical protein